MTKDESDLLAGAASTTPGRWWSCSPPSAASIRTTATARRCTSSSGLRALGVPVTVHEPQLYLTLPKGAFVEAEGGACSRGRRR